ncbi:MAG: reverse transcriptase domain-containing protein, partial [Sedimenticola sp.]
MKKFNVHVEKHYFKMETLKSALTLVKQNVWFGSVDLRQAYYSVNIAEPDRIYMRFQFCDDLYEYTSLANGLSSAPRIFTKLMKPVFSTLRKLGHCNSIYIDDSLLQSDSYTECLQNVSDTITLVDSLGVRVHPEKYVT